MIKATEEVSDEAELNENGKERQAEIIQMLKDVKTP